MTTTTTGLSKSEDAMEGCTTDFSGNKRKPSFEAEEERRVKEAKIEEEEEEESSEYGVEDDFNIVQSPKWDEDSFEDLEYYDSDDAKAYTDDDEEYRSKLKVLNEHYREYKRQIIESKGFKGDANLKPNVRFKNIYPVSLDTELQKGLTFHDYFEQMVHVCLKKLNEEKTNAKEPELEFVQLIRGNYHGGPRTVGYITFLAKEKPDGSPVEYQAKCMVTLDQKMHPMLCRRAPPAAI